MAQSLSTQQVTDYRANGYVAPLDALDAAAVAHYRGELERTEAHLGGSLMAIDRKYRGNLHMMCRWMDELARTPAILDAVESLIGPDILLYTSRFFIKEPNSEGIAAWHQDCTYFGLRPYDHVTAWVALSDVTEDAGPLEFAVGSHIRGALLQKSGVVKNSVNTAGQIIVEWFDQSRIDRAILRAGQFSLHHTCVVHQSAPNRRDERRIGIALSYIPTRTRYIGNRRMPAYLVRGQDTYGHFDLQPPPARDFGAEEVARHEVTFKAYIDTFFEQLDEAERHLPREVAEGLVY
ncbi:MAG: phytanoyl-CoA dioxygenase family protein [Pseudomonadota bacterium]|jgi:ectoine hydroxylase-related dioxygenase (phytanoyl-CoA dioxygenase family)